MLITCRATIFDHNFIYPSQYQTISERYKCRIFGPIWFSQGKVILRIQQLQFIAIATNLTFILMQFIISSMWLRLSVHSETTGAGNGEILFLKMYAKDLNLNAVLLEMYAGTVTNVTDLITNVIVDAIVVFVISPSIN